MLALEGKFAEHVSQYGIMMATMAEFEFRFNLFKQTDIALQEINNEEGNTFIVGHNKFSTMTADEKNRYKGRKPNVNKGKMTIEHLPTDNLSASVDWRQKGAVNRVQNQGSCGSCWAFSATAAMEGAHFIKTGKLLKLSESNLVDCDPQSYGCGGGLESWAFEYLENHAQELESDYPYVAKTRTCDWESSKGVVRDLDYTEVPARSVSALKAAIDKQPTCVSVDCGTPWMNYESGILNSRSCGTDLDHAVTAVGYGSENGNGYFIVRNSWGSDWGENGYIRMSSDVEGSGVCGVLLDSVRPTTN